MIIEILSAVVPIAATGSVAWAIRIENRLGKMEILATERLKDVREDIQRLDSKIDTLTSFLLRQHVKDPS